VDPLRARRQPRAGPPALPRAGGRGQGALRRGNARGGVLHRDRPRLRGRGDSGGGDGVRGAAAALRHELIGLGGVVERNWYLVKRYAVWELAWFAWTVANTLTIVFIAEGIEASGGHIDVKKETTVLLIGAVMWSYLG